MPKSKEYVSTSEEGSESSGSESPKPKKQKVEMPKKAEPKAEKSSKGGGGSSTKAEKGANGEVMFPLSQMRYATVSEFRGKKLISIREYYEKDGKILPGKKGISLSVDQWNTLQDLMDDINQAVKTF